MSFDERPRRTGKRRGAVLVEAALYLLPFLAILLGIFDFSISIWMKNTLQHAVREGVRYAVTYQTEAGMGHDA
jgi:Flp pilus assembly protein TadG